MIGGGAAGFFCAVNAARLHKGLQVILLEKSGKLLSKVKVSGGGRCNVTHSCFDIDDMSRNYPRGSSFIRKAFYKFFTRDTINWFEERGVVMKTEKDSRMFPVTDSSQTIIDCLLKEAERYAVEIKMNTGVEKLAPSGNGFHIQTSNGKMLETDYVCVACGGYPRISMFNWLSETGHTIEEPVPSLFTFNLPGNPITKLMGVSVPNAKVKITGTKLEENGPLLITHWGLSGPVVLRLSAWGARELAKMNWNFSIRINWVNELDERQAAEKLSTLRFDHASQKISGKNNFDLPQRLWEFLVMIAGIDPGKRWADLPAKQQNRLAKEMTGMEFSVKGKTTFKEEFVTAGGIKLSEVDPNTMMSKKHPGLFFAGEILDVDGITGGFNFQHAWTSGFIAAQNIGNQ